MRHLIVLAVFCATFLTTSEMAGQTEEQVSAGETMQGYLRNFEKDDNRRYYIQEVVMSEGHSQEQLFNGLKIWMSEHFESEDFAFTTDNIDEGMLIARGWTYSGLTSDASILRMYHSIKIEVREGKYRFSIFNIEFDNGSVAVSTLSDLINVAYHENGQIDLGADNTFALEALESVMQSKEALNSLDMDFLLSDSTR